ncbi:ATPase, V1 complex, subunit C [Ostreococcus tauri]|uniref:V-type proton ATPase subunit C n=1 Tax=Ostreococcus tauri TaxID=70448 RepID=Q014K5_OSTTA|nr:ATPase, V1 complex, subunit C [Ostreococcus tauri]OUS47236.1 putative vacuolar ATP synthase subunit C [Ostreococcus tauri]CAL54674.1 ATPase, V1 complex, subunit C [Ostreococcus tauri]|eukprot:XP_003080507.1 ATPase, V1 complex, subunit C [Ostreococcus tauri]
MTTTYWLVSLPLLGTSAEEQFGTLRRHTSGANELSTNVRVRVPELRVGTLDSLLALSDDLVKTCALAESTLDKVRRQHVDLTSTSDRSTGRELTIDGESVEKFLTTFEWDEGKHPCRRALRETVEKLSERLGRIEDEFKLKCGQLSTSRNHLNSLGRRTGGGVNSKDLSELINPADLVESENLTTLVVQVPKMRTEDWVSNYETLSNFVVPRSSKVLYAEGDTELRTVVLFRRVVDAFINAAREIGCTAREYSHDPEASRAAKDQKDALEREFAERKESLTEWCEISYGEIFSTMMHLCTVRIFVESILRYGLPPDFQTVLMRPNMKNATKLRKVLNQEFGKDASSHWDDDGGGDEERTGLNAEDMYSYVSLTLKV